MSKKNRKRIGSQNQINYFFQLPKFYFQTDFGSEIRKRIQSYQMPFSPILKSWEQKQRESLLGRITKCSLIDSISLRHPLDGCVNEENFARLNSSSSHKDQARQVLSCSSD